MAKRAQLARRKKKGLDAELTRFLVMLSFDEDLRQRYNADPAAVVAAWPFRLDPVAKKALENQSKQGVLEALISQFGLISRLKRKRSSRKVR